MKILMVMAHPDDEVIFGWPILFDDNIQKEILICSSDENNPERKWCAYRKKALQNMCDSLQIQQICFPYNSEFYRMETRQESLKKMLNHIRTTIEQKSFDAIFTHNVLGEYGHIDHQIIHQLVMQINCEVITTDIYMETNWMPYSGFSDKLKKVYFQGKKQIYNNDIVKYNCCKKFYTALKVWTWSKEPVMNCGVYTI